MTNLRISFSLLAVASLASVQVNINQEPVFSAGNISVVVS